MRERKVAQWSAILFALGSLMVAAYAVHQNQPWVAGLFASGTLAAVVAALLGRNRSPSKTPQKN